jgi:poly(hydroxyalkanoate) depolymerase family esterase
MNLLAEEQTCFVAYPAQILAANASGCWNWFASDHQRRGAGEPSIIAGITRAIMSDFSIDPRRVYVAGLSAGGAAAAVLGAAYPDLYAAVGVHSGLACGAARDLASAFAAMRQGGMPAAGQARGGRMVPTIVFHGSGDTTVNPRNGAQVIAQAAASAPGLTTRVELGQRPGGHAYRRTLHVDAAGRIMLEHWDVEGGGHAWFGGSSAGSYTDPRGPDASGEMLRFFLSHRHTAPAT